MKKIQLSLDELKVESFEIAPAAEKRGRGTVMAFESGVLDPTCDLSCATCDPSCQPTCGILPGPDDGAKFEPPWCV